mmetsp:Transcript_8096/g.33370  ORF Transcript_8096/g.33370 Transcript_8096/m.33370 type:complete len:225 (+) Transcript_8096:130-804(+)
MWALMRNCSLVRRRTSRRKVSRSTWFRYRNSSSAKSTSSMAFESATFSRSCAESGSRGATAAAGVSLLSSIHFSSCDVLARVSSATPRIEEPFGTPASSTYSRARSSLDCVASSTSMARRSASKKSASRDCSLVVSCVRGEASDGGEASVVVVVVAGCVVSARVAYDGGGSSARIGDASSAEDDPEGGAFVEGLTKSGGFEEKIDEAMVQSSTNVEEPPAHEDR